MYPSCSLESLVGSLAATRGPVTTGRRSPGPAADLPGQWALPWYLSLLILLQGDRHGRRRRWNPATSQARRIPALPLSLALALPVWARAMPMGRAAGKERERRLGWFAWPGSGSVSPARPPSTVCLHRLLFSLPACPTGLLGRHRYYCPQRTPPARPKGGVTHGAATSPQPARGV